MSRNIRKYKSTTSQIAGIAICLFLLFSCNPAKKVASGSYLLDKNIVTVDNKKVDKNELAKYVKQIPNRRIVGFKFNLWLYNISKESKDNRLNRWLRKTGEPPVIYDPSLRKKSSTQIQLYLQNLGYYNSEIKDTVALKGKHASTYYTITTGDPYKIRNIYYRFEDSTLMHYVVQDTAKCLIKRNDLFDLNVLQNERSRIENLLKNQGFYNFNREYTTFEVDSNFNSHQVDITLILSKYVVRDSLNVVHINKHHRYSIHNVFVIPDYDPLKADSIQARDTLLIDSIYFVFKGSLTHNPHIIEQCILVQPHDYYSSNNVDESYKKLTLLRNFKIINIVFKEVADDDSGYFLDCYVQLNPLLPQSYQTEIEGTNSGGNLGVATNFIYQHKNVFKKAQIFDFKIHGAYEAMRKVNQKSVALDSIYNTYEIGVEARLNIPQFLLPFRSEHFIRKYSPKTNIVLAYNYRVRPDYTQTVANASFGYAWKGNAFTSYTITPIDVNYVLPDMKPAFREIINQTFLRYSYQEVLINSLSASLIYTNQVNKNIRSFYLSLRGETAGALLRASSNLMGLSRDSLNAYQLFGTGFAQFVKTDFEMRFNYPLNATDRVVYRIFAGIGVPYGNSKSMPYIRQYFGGGPYGLRAWQIRTLGPGSSKNINQDAFPNQTGDMKLEANIEYRFKLIGKVEGAMFVDAGNIWNVQKDDPAGSQFHFVSNTRNAFYDQIAVSTGLGLRFDFSLFVLRLDLGFKTRDPLAPEGKRWIITNQYFSKPTYIYDNPKDAAKASIRNNIGFNFAIGYPF